MTQGTTIVHRLIVSAPAYVIALLLLFSFWAQAFPSETVAQLYKECGRADNIEDQYSCKGYVQAALEDFYGVHGCPSYESLTVDKQTAIFLAWASAHPKFSSMDAMSGIKKSSENLIKDCPMPVKGLPPIDN
jgi:hypothetical protein